MVGGRRITKEEWAEIMKLREASTEQLAFLAEQCGCQTEMLDGKLVLSNNPAVEWNPIERLNQSHKLLGAVIAKGDCKLFYDDGVNEYFIYQYTPGPEYGPPLAHRQNLNEVAFEAAMNLWFPEEE